MNLQSTSGRLFGVRRLDEAGALFGLEKRVRQRDGFDVFHARVVAELGIDVEEHWHVHLWG